MYDNVLTVGSALYAVSAFVSLFLSGLLFRDLADVSQWVVQTARHTTMRVWYHRHAIAIASLLSFATSIGLLWYNQDTVSIWLGLSASLLFLLFFYSGYINPHIMMRARMKNGVFVSVEQAKKHYSDQESVIVIDIDGEARAHSDRQMLRPHVAGNGQSMGGEEVVMTYCGLTNLGIAYTPEIDGQAVDLAPMNQLENNLVMYDKVTGEPIQQIWGSKEADVNACACAPRMKEHPTFRMPFAKFAQAYPEGQVFLNDYLIKEMRPSFWKNPFLAIYDPIMDLLFKSANVYQAKSDKPVFPTIEVKDTRLASKTLIWGVNVENDYVAYTEQFVREHNGIINTTVGGKAVVVAYDEHFQSLGIFYNHSGADIDTIDFWGNTLHGKLSRVESVKAGAYWMVWANFFPETDLNRG
ncbi:DUF3179 domain-containing (seleno)protein [Aliagarivorans marinus]|uniref:DUF3179 domain-containing (seleno)protein n=1 Tax=Aliagarivorans marinus TaxID=561965 RepID=UPI00047B5E1F|nr:DUF3179 domain-containing (seleno)protein [Aliagarivorans marinus]